MTAPSKIEQMPDAIAEDRQRHRLPPDDDSADRDGSVVNPLSTKRRRTARTSPVSADRPKPDHYISGLPCEWIAKAAGHGQAAVPLALALFWRSAIKRHGQFSVSHRQLTLFGARLSAVPPALKVLFRLGMVRVIKIGNGRDKSVYELDLGPVANEKFKASRAAIRKNSSKSGQDGDNDVDRQQRDERDDKDIDVSGGTKDGSWEDD